MIVKDLIKLMNDYENIEIIDKNNMNKLYVGTVKDFLELNNDYIFNKKIEEINCVGNYYFCEDFLNLDMEVGLEIYI